MQLFFLALTLCLAVSLMCGHTSAFMPGSGVIGSRHTTSRRNIDMLFGGTRKKSATKSKSVTIKVDGKEITSDSAPFNLRKTLQDNNVNVYPLKSKLTGNCGGAGICGTCAVKVISGENNISKPSKNEQNTLQGKPADFRLSCCSRVSGPIACKTKVW